MEGHQAVQGAQGSSLPVFGGTMLPNSFVAAMRQVAADRAERDELERKRVVRLENQVRDLISQLVRYGVLRFWASAYREDLEQERVTNGGLRVEVNTLHEDLEQARAIAVGLKAQVAAVEQENQVLYYRKQQLACSTLSRDHYNYVFFF